MNRIAIALFAAAIAIATVCHGAQNRAWCRPTADGRGVVYAPDLLWPSMTPPTPAQYRAAGWLKNAVQSAAASNGCHVASVRYEARDGRVVAVYGYAANPPPVYRYSKLKLITAAKSVGKWDTLKAFVKSAGLEDEWLACQYLEDGYPAIVDGTNAVVGAGLATGAEVEKLLEESRDE